MEIILTEQCKSFTGSLGSGFGYAIRTYKSKKGKVRFFSKQNSKGCVPPDGHWRFIVACAELAQSKLHIADIRIGRGEVMDALLEAGHRNAAGCLFFNQKEFPSIFSAENILNLKTTFGL